MMFTTQQREESPAIECFKPEAMWKYITTEECFKAHGVNPERAK